MVPRLNVVPPQVPVLVALKPFRKRQEQKQDQRKINRICLV
jgi:hypothetical protein